MSLRDDAKRFARLDEILLPHEKKRQEEFIDMMVQVAVGLAAGEEPSPITWTTARAVISEVWRLDRETSDGRAVKELVLDEPSFSAARQNNFRDAKDRNVRKQIAVDGIRTALDMHDTILAACKGELVQTGDGKLIPMRKRK